jgi:hypothetical protein
VNLLEVEKSRGFESFALKKLTSKLPGLRKCGLRPTLREAVKSFYNEAFDIWGVAAQIDLRISDLNTSRRTGQRPAPGFIPDATKVFYPETIQIFEIEDSIKISPEKLETIKWWDYSVWDQFDCSFYTELYSVNRYGTSAILIYSLDHDSVSPLGPPFGFDILNSPEFVKPARPEFIALPISEDHMRKMAARMTNL